MLNNSTILGINPGARFVGLAVIRNSKLVDWRIKAFNKGKWSKEKLKSILSTLDSYIQQHRVTILALKRFHPSRSSKALDSLVKKIDELAKRKKIKTYQYSIDEIKDCFANDEDLNKRGLAEVLATSNNELFDEFNKEIRNKNAYYLPMFEAIGLSLLCKQDLELR